MRRSRYSRGVPTVLLSLLVVVGTVAVASVPAGAGTKWKIAVSDTTVNSLAETNTLIKNPVKIEVTVNKAALVQWTVECTKGGTPITLPSGKKTLTTAGSIQLKITKSATQCQPSANALDDGKGVLKLSIEYSGGSVER